MKLTTIALAIAFTGNTLAPIAHDPSGSTLIGSAINRGG